MLLVLLLVVGATADCGNQTIAPVFPNIRVVGGVEAEPHSWPWTIQLMGNNGHICGGTLIHPQWVLTAAHCTEGPQTYRDSLKVSVGSHNRDTLDPQEQEITILEIFDHLDYNSFSLDNDISMLQLTKNVVYNDHVDECCVAPLHYMPDTVCYNVGWGDTQGTGNPLVLNQVDLPIVSNADCNQLGWYNGQVTDNMVCAGYTAGGKDSCFGDSGGPLMCLNSEGAWEVFGIVSWGAADECAQPNKPGVYTRVPNYAAWINTLIDQMTIPL